MGFATLVDNKRGVCDDIKYTWTNLRIVRLGIPRTHGWVELASTVPTSSSNRSSTVPVGYCAVSCDRPRWPVTCITTKHYC